MRKRSKYRPKGVRLDVMQWVIGGMQPVTAAKDEILTLRIKNHMALDVLRKGQGGRSEMDVVIAALNITEALARLRIGNDLAKEIRAGQDALYATAQRGAKLNHFIFTGPELTAVNLAVEIHDAQLNVCTVGELEKAVEIVKRELRARKARVIELQDE